MCEKNLIRERVEFIVIFVLLMVLVLPFLSTPAMATVVEENPDQITLSWTDDPKTSQTIVWRTSHDVTKGTVQYVPAVDFKGSFSKARQKEAILTELNENNNHNHFEATINQLMPETEYIYRVGTKGAWSKPLSFTTASETDTFSFLYMGDVQAGYEQWGRMLHEAYAAHPNLKFSLMGGDLVDNGDDSGEWAQFLSQTAGVFDCMPLMPTLGNHDDSRNTYYLKHFALPQNGPSHLKERFYSFNYGNAHFVILDSNRMGNEGLLYEEASQWLKKDLSDSHQRWKFVMFHHPPYPAHAGKEHDALQEKWVPILEENDVDMVFVGHQHVYMRTYPLYGGKIQQQPQDGVVYIMGNAGTKHYNYDDFDYMAAVSAGATYQVIDITEDALTLTAKEARGKVVDTYIIDKGNTMDGLSWYDQHLLLMINLLGMIQGALNI